MRFTPPDPSSQEELERFLVGLQGLPRDEVRQAKVLYLRNAVSAYQAFKASGDAIGQSHGCLSWIPVFWPIIAAEKRVMEAQVRLAEARIRNAIATWRDDLQGEQFDFDDTAPASPGSRAASASSRSLPADDEKAADHQSPNPDRSASLSPAWTGALAAIAWAFPWAAVVALVYGFPVPFAGKLHGPEAVLPSLFAVVFYGVIGGFVVLGLLGALTGIVAHRLAGPNRETANLMSWIFAGGVSGVCVVGLAVLDQVIGPW